MSYSYFRTFHNVFLSPSAQSPLKTESIFDLLLHSSEYFWIGRWISHVRLQCYGMFQVLRGTCWKVIDTWDAHNIMHWNSFTYLLVMKARSFTSWCFFWPIFSNFQLPRSSFDSSAAQETASKQLLPIFGHISCLHLAAYRILQLINLAPSLNLSLNIIMPLYCSTSPPENTLCVLLAFC